MIELPYGRFEIIGTVSLPTEAVLAQAPEEPKKFPWKWILLGGAVIVAIIALTVDRKK